jgi:hypothetical protein
VTLPSGGIIEMWSLDTPHPARGRKYKTIVLEEAALAPELQDRWQRAIRPAEQRRDIEAGLFLGPADHVCETGPPESIRFAAGAAKAIRNWDQKSGLVIALFEDWGSGKSSLKNMILEERHLYRYY